ncbi:glycosyltransferase family 4 protein [Pseudorhodoplanes sinuspersici]|uniref:Lipopolysaccharide biosynthesis protein n=1 Tax=Pseudorhodoplanes sinuspersici TaxID=1235591 RepID=A0A1W6ZTK8_9HYPH|nr:glycosyltransferase family 4 protein [Pseudorhodoplanes sinuspersici]ARQ00682.1 lipopolysaccharide biosynthesis protein [Pseudorhodoplanes sinuspersici]RKE72288.1 mannosyltransferase [Pseudorhodoplanes sinuspersici]
MGNKGAKSQPATTILTDLNVIIPNLHWNYTGVTATNRMIAPRVARLMTARWLGPDAPAGVETMTFGDLLTLRSSARRPIVWHARRNNEMMAGLALKWLGWPLRLVFTSAAQRHHTGITRWLIKRMDAVIATSPASASYLKVPCEVILHGVDIERYRPPDNREAELREGDIRSKYAIGCFGRVRHQKGTDVFIEAMCRLLPRYPDFSAVVIGAIDDASFEARLKERVAQSGLQDRVHILGELPIDDVPPWYRRVLIYAFTSRNEGFGLTILEAMASGDALVAARAGAAEAVVTDGQNGVLVPTGDADALAAALESLMRDPDAAAAMGERARAHVVAQFSVEAEAEKYAAVYRRVLAGV